MTKRPADDADQAAPRPSVGAVPRSREDSPVLPDITSDEQDAGWGDEPTRRDDDWYLSERPPHHG
jgi:hypothetical protein